MFGVFLDRFCSVSADWAAAFFFLKVKVVELRQVHPNHDFTLEALYNMAAVKTWWIMATNIIFSCRPKRYQNTSPKG